MVDVANADAVAVLTRAVIGGRTRLFATLGRPSDPDLRAARLLEHHRWPHDAGVRVVVAVTPAGACDETAQLIVGLDRIAPQQRDLTLTPSCHGRAMAELCGGGSEVSCMHTWQVF